MTWIAEYVRIAIILILPVSVVACASNNLSLSPPTLGGYVEFRVSGGFGGVRQSLRVEDNGLTTARDERRRTEVRRQLDGARLRQIRMAFAKLKLGKDGAATMLTHRCADCFTYTIVATIDSAHFQATTNSSVLNQSAYAEIVVTLSDILDDALSSPITAAP